MIGVLVAIQVPPPPPVATEASRLRRAQATIRAEETAQLNALRDRVKREGNADAAREVDRQIAANTVADGASRFAPLPDVVTSAAKGLANIPATPKGVEPWKAELRAVREAAAKQLLQLAQRAAAANPKEFALADECLRAVLERQPEQAEARRLLGYVPHQGGWATPFAVGQLKRGMVLDSRFGWVDASWLPHLDRGELPGPGTRGVTRVRWLPAAEADELHGAWASRWQIFTEHFRIETDVAFAEAIAFGRQLEAFHQLFFALLADVLATDNRLPLAQRFRDAHAVVKSSDPHVVYFFANKQEYVDHLAPVLGPEIGKTLGIYVPAKPGKKRAPAYFYRDPGGQVDAAATLYHEVSHQLLFESAGPNQYDKNVGNYWAFEGLGTYFETVVSEADGALSVGGMVGPRMNEARVRLLDRGEFIPIATLVRLGQSEFNRAENVHLHYAEAMALAVFLMKANGAQYRDAFLDYVKDAYRGRLRQTTGRSLEDRLGVPYETLDEQFLAYLKRG
jgi:hypothetical protein